MASKGIARLEPVYALLRSDGVRAVYELLRNRRLRAVWASVRSRQFASAAVSETVEEMKPDLRQGVQASYLRLLGYTFVVAIGLVLASFVLYDDVLPVVFNAVGIGDGILQQGFEDGTDLLLFALVASVPVSNLARLLFVARISGKNAAEMFTLRSLFRREGVELVVLFVAVPFLSKQLFEATGLSSMLDTLGPLVNTLPSEWNVDIAAVKRYAVVLSVLYLYPAIVLVYLSHSKLSRLYPFTQFLSVAKSWSYLVLVLTTVPVASGAVLLVVVADERSPSDFLFLFAFILLSLVTLQFVFNRLGAVVMADEKLRQTFMPEVDKEVQLTLSDFS